MSEPSSTGRFLIVRLGSLGDVIHAIPAAAALRRAFPHARIDWVVDPRYVEVLGLVSGLDERIGFDPRAAVAGLLTTIRRLRRVGYDATIDLQGLLKSAVLARAAGAQRTIGFPRVHLREPPARFFYSETPDPGVAEHVVHKNVALLAPLGVRDRTLSFPLRIPRTPAVDAVAARMRDDGYAVLNPGAAWSNKRWPADRFGELAGALRERAGLRSIVLWGPGEEPLASAVAAASRGAADVSPKTGIVDVFGVARGARLMVSGDTGPLHIAAAVGTPVVALFGPTRAERNGPWAADDITVSRYDRCSCHYERRCRRSTSCINDISVDEVLAAVERRMLASPRRAREAGHG